MDERSGRSLKGMIVAPLVVPQQRFIFRHVANPKTCWLNDTREVFLLPLLLSRAIVDGQRI